MNGSPQKDGTARSRSGPPGDSSLVKRLFRVPEVDEANQLGFVNLWNSKRRSNGHDGHRTAPPATRGRCVYVSGPTAAARREEEDMRMNLMAWLGRGAGPYPAASQPNAETHTPPTPLHHQVTQDDLRPAGRQSRTWDAQRGVGASPQRVRKIKNR
ncbi:unnamed protein product [Lota lota]